jgi:hypothetical protein
MEVAIDMDPLGTDARAQPLPANGDPNPANGTLGSRQTCTSRNVNQTLQIDIAVRGIDPANRMSGFQFFLHYDPAKLKITAIDNGKMLATGGGSLLDFSDPVPDEDGVYSAAIADFGPNTEAGDGVLSRITLQSVGNGVSTISLDKVTIGDKSSVAIPTIASVLSAEEYQGQACPAPSQAPATATPTSTATPTASPSPAGSALPTTASPTPTLAGVSQTPLATGPSQTQTASPTVTATPAPGQDFIWGDHNCSGEANPVDSLLTLRFDAGLSTSTGPCPTMGQTVEVVGASPHAWADIDCSGAVDPVDSLKLLRFDAGLSVSQNALCPAVGSNVTVYMETRGFARID